MTALDDLAGRLRALRLPPRVSARELSGRCPACRSGALPAVDGRYGLRVSCACEPRLAVAGHHGPPADASFVTPPGPAGATRLTAGLCPRPVR